MAVCAACRATNEDTAEVCFHCGAVLGAITRGTVIAGRYEVTKRLGQGGMGVVYAAHDRVLDETIALKLLPMAEVDEATGKRFRSEIKLARRITHPNVCRIHDYGEEGARRYISMELVEGVDLKQVLRAGPLPPAEAYRTAIQVAEGLQAIHAAKVVHRDLKTPNLMRDTSGVVRVMDFGIAKQFGADAGTGQTGTGQIVGTPEYMSPEQVRGEPLDARSDVYALGIVIWELFTAQLPFRGDTPVATLFKHLNTPPPFDLAGARLPPALVPVLAKALAKSPGDRYPSAAALAEALREASRSSSEATTLIPVEQLQGRTTPPPMPSGLRPMVPAPPKKREPWVFLVVIGALAGGKMFFDLQKPDAPVPRPVAPTTLAAEAPVTMLAASPRAASLEARPTRPPETLPAVTMPRVAQAPTRTPPPTTVPPPAPAVESVGGELQIGVTPYAEVFVDGVSVGTTPMRPLLLKSGRHTVRLEHPEFQPLQRVVTVAPNVRGRLVVDLAADAIRR